MKHFFTFISLLFVLGSPHIALAQQVSDVKTIAENDAGSDVNTFLWFGAGLGTVGVCIPAAAGAGCLVGALIEPPEDTLGFAPLVGGMEPSAEMVTACFIGAFIGAVIPVIGSTLSITPPSKRFIGKSPEYIEAYTRAYESKVKQTRWKWLFSGAGTAGAIILLLSFIGSF